MIFRPVIPAYAGIQAKVEPVLDAGLRRHDDLKAPSSAGAGEGWGGGNLLLKPALPRPTTATTRPRCPDVRRAPDLATQRSDRRSLSGRRLTRGGWRGTLRPG